MKSIFKLFILAGIVLVGLSSCGETIPSQGVVTSRTQTSDKYGDPQFYIYVLDSRDHHIYQEQVSPTTYYYAKEGTKIRYDINTLVSSLHHIVIVHEE